MSQPDRLRYVLDRNFESSVVTINFEDWGKMVRPDGAPTRLEQIPDKLSGVLKTAEVVVAVASGIANHTPGIDIVRKDPRDAPFIFNTDHYIVVEKLTQHPDYSSFVRRAGVQDSEELRDALDSWVWIIGPKRDPENHWSKEIPNISDRQRKRPNPEVSFRRSPE
jgi:hypothetical protein